MSEDDQAADISTFQPRTPEETFGLRQRKPEPTPASPRQHKPPPPTPGSMLAKKLADRARLDQFIAAAASGSPPWLAKLIHQFAPAIAVLVTLINVLGPLYLKAAELAFFLYQTLPMDILYAMMGLAMCFCGGAYCASIAAVEAFALLGWSTTRAALEDIYDDVLLIKAAAAEDDKKDDDGDGTPDVQQLAPAALLQRKLRVFALAVRDPEKLSLAIGGLYTGWIAVQGTLRLQFAKTITLGVSIASMLDGPALRYGLPALAHLVPAPYHKWLPTMIRSGCKTVAVAVAWYVQVAISACQSAMRGGLICSRALLRFANKQRWIDVREEDTKLDEVVGYSLAVLGFYTQFRYGFALPFPFNIVMFPFTCIEWYIRWSVTSTA